MPIFEYRCQNCGKKATVLVGVTAEPDDETCPSCGARELQKLVSRFKKGRTEDDRVDQLADRLELMGEPDSPTQMRELVREMGKAMDDDMSDDMEEMFEADMAEDTAPE